MGDSHSSTVLDPEARAPVWVHQSRSGAPAERSAEGHRHWTATVLSSLSRTGRKTDHNRARPQPPAQSNPRRRPANHRTGHFSNRQVTSITRPTTGRAQPMPTQDKRQKETGPNEGGLPGDIYHYINIQFHAYPYSHVYIHAETTIVVSDICYDNYQLAMAEGLTTLISNQSYLLLHWHTTFSK